MTNAQHSHKHGMTQANTLRPKSKLRTRVNKANANARKAERRALKASILS